MIDKIVVLKTAFTIYLLASLFVPAVAFPSFAQPPSNWIEPYEFYGLDKDQLKKKLDKIDPNAFVNRERPAVESPTEIVIDDEFGPCFFSFTWIAGKICSVCATKHIAHGAEEQVCVSDLNSGLQVTIDDLTQKIDRSELFLKERGLQKLLTSAPDSRSIFTESNWSCISYAVLLRERCRLLLKRAEASRIAGLDVKSKSDNKLAEVCCELLMQLRMLLTEQEWMALTSS